MSNATRPTTETTGGDCEESPSFDVCKIPIYIVVGVVSGFNIICLTILLIVKSRKMKKKEKYRLRRSTLMESLRSSERDRREASKTPVEETRENVTAKLPPKPENVASVTSIESNKSTHTAMYNYKARAPDEVSFVDGDVISDVESIHGDEGETYGWMYGTVVRTGDRGLLPGNYITNTPFSDHHYKAQQEEKMWGKYRPH